MMWFWVGGYVIGVLAMGAALAWGWDEDKPTSKQLAVAGAIILFWPPFMALLCGVAIFCFFLALFKPSINQERGVGK